VKAPDDLSPALPKDYLRPCLLLLLREQPAHGYDLLQRLRPLGFVRDDPGGLYRALRALEQDGLVRSSWDDSGSGPDRRVYRVTRAGLEELHQSAKSLANVREALDAFLDRTGEAGRTHR
jgi:PadR family transcriptional regulator, regulatory protein PadR